MSSPTLAPSSPDKTKEILAWLEEIVRTSLTDEPAGVPKRKYSSPNSTNAPARPTISTHRDVSPSKRQHQDTRDADLEQGKSALGSTACPLIVSSSSTLNPPSSFATSTQSDSPSRKSTSTKECNNRATRATIAQLKVASSRIITEPFGAGLQPLARVAAAVA